MKLLFLIFPTLLFANTISFVGPCSSDPLLEETFQLKTESYLGEVSIKSLENNKVPYLGNERGLNSIYNTPTGSQAIEVVSDETLRAYGWCFSINGEIPDKMPDEIELTGEGNEIIWFFAFSTSTRNQWVDYCVPAHQVAPNFLCSKGEQ